ncbi:hypothetical protein C8J57DRAFT_1567278 [Mycena rebaudengoi]|nr:hypothetical protein C8J57DRAFT_1567278 [Mycena rebaudengoi]
MQFAVSINLCQHHQHQHNAADAILNFVAASPSTLCLPLHTSDSVELPQITTMDTLVVKHYHETVQAMHDDDALDKASAALRSILDHQQRDPWEPLWEEETATLVHLLSPEASIRANRTAAAAIAGFGVHKASYLPQKVIITLVHAARRSVGSASITTLESSVFLAAMVQCIIQYVGLGTVTV